MQQIDFYMVDAFTTTTFGGNAAAVCPLDDWLPDEILLKMSPEQSSHAEEIIKAYAKSFGIIS